MDKREELDATIDFDKISEPPKVITEADFAEAQGHLAGCFTVETLEALDTCIRALARTEIANAPRSCTCHPDDNPPQPCPQKFTYSECVAAADPK